MAEEERENGEDRGHSLAPRWARPGGGKVGAALQNRSRLAHYACLQPVAGREGHEAGGGSGGARGKKGTRSKRRTRVSAWASEQQLCFLMSPMLHCYFGFPIHTPSIVFLCLNVHVPISTCSGFFFQLAKGAKVCNKGYRIG